MRLGAVLFIAVLARTANAQAPDSAHHPAGATVVGVVRDSIARAPLVDATVQLVAANDPARLLRTTSSDSLGRFMLKDVPLGTYLLGFFHPILDSLGVEIPLRQVRIDSAVSIRAELAVPSAARLRSVICGSRAEGDDGGVLIGVVRNAQDGAPLRDATIATEWIEYSFVKRAMSRHTVSRVANTGSNGWFAMCNVPVGGMLALVASRGADSTDVIEVLVPGEGFVRRDLYLGAMRTETPPAASASAIAGSKRMVHVGSGKLSGTVIRAANGVPLIGAIVRIKDGPQTRTNELGEWTIPNAPLGTRMLEIRALGYYPDSRHVNVVGTPEPMEIGMATVQEVLDTVMIRARRIYTRGDNGFKDRRHTGVGRYMTEEDIARRPATFTSDLFRTMSGLRLGYASDTIATDMVLAVNPDDMAPIDRRILMRGISGDWCAPSVFLDGTRMSQLGAGDIDAWVRPKDVAGIEVYSEATVPPEFTDPRSGCGSIVIWRKDPFANAKTPQRLQH